MSQIYGCSSKLALSAVHRNIHRAGLASNPRFHQSSLYDRPSYAWPHSASRQLNTTRYFSSLPGVHSSNSEDNPSQLHETSSNSAIHTLKQSPKDTADANAPVYDDLISSSADTQTITDTPTSATPDKKKIKKNKKDKKDKYKKQNERQGSVLWRSVRRDSATEKQTHGNEDSKISTKNDSKSPSEKKEREQWQIQKEALKEKFKEGWNPAKKLSPDAMEGIRHLHATDPQRFTTPVLAEQFKVSPEAIRRILKSKWRPSEEEMVDRQKRWQRRHDRIWSQMSELGLRPMTKRAEKVGDAKILYEDR